MIKKICFFVLILLLNSGRSQNGNETIFSKIIRNQYPKTNNEKFLAIAKQFLGRPYVANSLESDSTEKLVVNLNEFDCFTLVESCLALNQLNAKSNFSDYQKMLTKIRYRNGILNGYGSRLHYTSEWALQNEKNLIFKDITKLLGGIIYDKKINFISAHFSLYPKINSQKIRDEIINSEKLLNNTIKYFIPKENVEKIEPLLNNGDIIEITTNLAGLDCSHVGIVTIENGIVKLLHASLDFKKVIISNDSLHDYLKKNKKQTGIMVYRLN